MLQKMCWHKASRQSLPVSRYEYKIVSLLRERTETIRQLHGGYPVKQIPDDNSVVLKGEGGCLRGRLPTLSGAIRSGKGPPLACSNCAAAFSSASVITRVRVRFSVQYTAFRSCSIRGLGREMVIRCFSRGGAALSIPLCGGWFEICELFTISRLGDRTECHLQIKFQSEAVEPNCLSS